MSADSIEFVPILRRLSMHPALRDMGVVGLSSFLAAIAAMLVISIVGKAFGPILLGEYLLIRRMAAWLQAGVQLPSGVALPRYVAANLDGPNSTKIAYFVAALMTACAIGFLLCFVLLLWPIQISGLFFGSPELVHLVLPLCILLMGLAVHGVVFGYLQGVLQMARASVLQICNLAVLPVLTVVLLRPRHSIPLIVDTIGLLMILFSCLFALPILWGGEFSLSAERLKKQGSELLSYGFSRVSGDFGLQALLSLPAVIAAHYFPMSSVAYLLLAGSFLAVVSAATLPLGIILLSRVSRSIAQMGTKQLQTPVSYFISALIELSVFICLQMILFADVVIRSWVGPTFLQGLRVIQIAILAVPFYFVYAGLRGVVDAASVKAYNTRNIYLAGVAFLVCVVPVRIFVPNRWLLGGLAGAGVAGMVVLAGCTLWTVTQLFSINMDWPQLIPGIGVGVLLGVLSFWIHNMLQYQPGAIALLAYEIALSAIYLLVLVLINPPWLRFFRSNMLTHSSPSKGEAND